MTAADATWVEPLEIAYVHDLRSRQEREAEPTAWPSRRHPITRVVAYDLNLEEISAMASSNDAAQLKSLLAREYPRILQTHRDHMRSVFQDLLERKAPILIHCSAGKDRTGVVSAILLSAFGVSRDVVMQDYMLSNQFFAPSANSELMKMLSRVEPEYLAAVFADIDHRYGSVEVYLHAELGVGPADLKRLRRLYTEPGEEGAKSIGAHKHVAPLPNV